MEVGQRKPTWTLVMEMLARLHELGYQRLRLSCGAAPTGLSWRYSVAPVGQFQVDGYLLDPDVYPGVAFGSSPGHVTPFQWEEEAPDAESLARLFLERFPEVAEAGRGSDPEYARWFAEAVERCRPDGAPVMYGEYVDAQAEGRIDVTNGKWLTLPPPREAMP
jgi:hypothetical protein